jgi:hypothetical protein
MIQRKKHDDDHDEEKKESETAAASSAPIKAVMQPNYGPIQCDMVFESMDECVGCLDGIDDQQTFEEHLRDHAARQQQIAVEHGLSQAEATLIRLQMIDATGQEGIIQAAVESQLENILHNVCGGGGGGGGSDPNDDTTMSGDLCDGLLHPMDTTLPTSLPGNALVESRQCRSARSLVDAAATEDDNIMFIDDENHVHGIVDGAVQECVICSDSSLSVMDSSGGSTSISLSARKPTFCRLPCCGTEEDDDDNFKVCTACMLVLTMATRDGASRVGRCPRCRTWISILTLHSTCADMDIQKLETPGQCEVCQQIKQPLVSEDPPICDACYLGKEVALGYECEECHNGQLINSTLYRSQLTSTSFGNEMWPCNSCHKSTHWKIQFDQLPLIPAGDVPEEWGDDFLELARTRVRRARQGIAKLDLLGRDETGKKTKDDGCVVM